MVDVSTLHAPFKRIIDYDNQQLKEDVLPKYREMLCLFTDRYHLAAADTRAFYEPFLEFVEIWNRVLAQSLPPEVYGKLKHDEETLDPFYQHIEERMERLHSKLERGRPV
jgi:hypothetical protein